VFGLVRTQEKALTLTKHEIIPVIGDFTDPATFETQLAQCSIIIDNIIDSSGFKTNKSFLEASVRAAEKCTHHQKTFIYTSGLLVYGDSEEIRDETSPIIAELPKFQLRLQHEQLVCSQQKLRGVAIRPGFVYGSGIHPGNFLYGIFNNVTTKDSLIIRGRKDKKWSWVNRADLADAYLRVARSANLVKGEIFNIVGYPHDTPTWEQLHLAISSLAHFKGNVVYAEPDPSDFVSTYCEKSIVLHPQKAIDLLGWTPRHIGLLQELEIYFNAYKAENK
jgi:nucleoside-diphosphate-sugar epimerase